MTKEEVVRVLGEPATEHVIDAQNRTATYIPPLAFLTTQETGYIGFVVNFENGVVQDWRVLISKPSYEPDAMGPPALFKLWLISWPVILVVAFVLGFILGIPFAIDQRARMLRAFVAMKIPSRLPVEFAFITHGARLRDVIERAGDCTREIRFPVRPEEVHNYPLVEIKNGVSGIRALEYKLPYSGSLIVLPEYPFDNDSLVRAVYRWRDFPGRPSVGSHDDSLISE